MTDITETIERDGEEHAIELDIEWTYDRGEFIEAGHAFNGYGAGWSSHISARDPTTNEPIELTDAEIERFQERYPPDSEPDHDCDDRD